MLQVAFGSLPDTYASVASMAGLKGDFEQGMKNLKEIAGSNSPFAFESKLYLLFVENYMLKKQDINFNQLQELYTERPDNLLLNFVYSSLLIKNAYADKALIILNSRPQGNEYIDFPYMDFQTGEIFMYKGEYAQAKIYYQKFLKEYKGSNFIKDTNYKLLLSYWLSNDEAMARTYFPKILSEGKTVYDADKYAQKFAQKGELPNKIIMKSRLFFDGGYYKESQETLNTFPISTSTNQKDIIEYYYRSGRLQHVNGNNTLAINFYQKTIHLSQDVNYYFAPNSALQIGFIYKAQNKKDLAKTYFQKAMSYKDYEYKNSIDNKAKAALNELK